MAAPLVIPCFIPHQGCPHQCVFCNQSVITGHHGRISAVEIATLIRDYLLYKGERRRVEFAFFGGNFLGLPEKRIIALLAHIKPWMDRGEIHSVRCSTRPDTITTEKLDLIRPYGVSLVELGVQSMDNRVLAISERGHTREDTLSAVELLKAKGMRVGVQVMAGLPGDTTETALETVRVLAVLKPDLARIYPLLVLAGSKMAQWYERGEYLPLTLDQAVDQVKGMLKLFNRSGVPVIRMGLQAGEMMEDPSQMLAGPWHPAFGHLVYSDLMFDHACECIDGILNGQKTCHRIQLRVHPRSLSRLQGNKKANLDRLADRYPGLGITLVTDETLTQDGLVAALTK